MAGMPVNTIVLVHGGFVDGSGWEEVYKILKRDGYNVSIRLSKTHRPARPCPILPPQDGYLFLAKAKPVRS
jgi:hypothetical protein